MLLKVFAKARVLIGPVDGECDFLGAVGDAIVKAELVVSLGLGVEAKGRGGLPLNGMQPMSRRIIHPKLDRLLPLGRRHKGHVKPVALF